MSRIGKKPVPITSGVKIALQDHLLKFEGPKGKLTVPIPEGITVRQADGHLEILRDSDQRAALHGLTRALAASAVTGVSSGFTRELDITGTGSLHSADDANAQDSDAPQVTEGKPHIYAHLAWLLTLVFSILGVGLIILSRSSPVRSSYGK